MENPKKKLIHRLRYHYRLILINDDSFEEKFSFKLTPMNVFVGFSSSLVMFTVFIILVIFFTPLKEYVPGYTDTQTKRNVQQLLYKTDSLEEVLIAKEHYYRNLINILNGGTGLQDSSKSERGQKAKNPELGIRPKEQGFREGFEKEQKETKVNTNRKVSGMKRTHLPDLFLMNPTNGIVSNKFDRAGEHYAIDIAAVQNAPVKAVQAGMVVFADWTPMAGKTLAIQHPNNLLSIYKHNSALLKKVGTFVETGEVVAIVGNSGESTTGPHLHFELWENGKALNPEECLNMN